LDKILSPREYSRPIISIKDIEDISRTLKYNWTAWTAGWPREPLAKAYEGFSGGSINLIGRQLNISGFFIIFYIFIIFLEHIFFEAKKSIKFHIRKNKNIQT